MLVGDDAANNDVVSQAFLWERRQARDAKSSRATTGGAWKSVVRVCGPRGKFSRIRIRVYEYGASALVGGESRAGRL